MTDRYFALNKLGLWPIVTKHITDGIFGCLIRIVWCVLDYVMGELALGGSLGYPDKSSPYKFLTMLHLNLVSVDPVLVGMDRVVVNSNAFRNANRPLVTSSPKPTALVSAHLAPSSDAHIAWLNTFLGMERTPMLCVEVTKQGIV